MTLSIPELGEEIDVSRMCEWLRIVIEKIGPCFHFDTPPEDYTFPDGKPLLSKKGRRRLDRGLSRASVILGRDFFEDVCLKCVWEQMGVHYDENLDRLVPVAFQSSKCGDA